MNEMIERVARAIYAAYGFKKTWEQSPGWHRSCMQSARAAIEAMRDCTREMVAAAANTSGMKEVDGMVGDVAARNPHHILRWEERGEESPIHQAWKAMIDEALK